jgi:UDP-N-acetylmuramoyl-L-alanyl-D-glutamate--2,6-diaminopimelate ligase
MRLSALVAALPPELTPGRGVHADADDPVVRGVCYDSRAVAPGDAFFALRGAEVDGHDYLPQALELGAAVVFVEEIPAGLDLRGRPAVVVPDARRALAQVARHFFGAPADELFLVGVTGTNGKTSTSYLVESIFAEAGRRVGLIGTVGVRYADVWQRAMNTTPESLDIQRALREMRTAGVDTVVMEVSSHGLELGRVAGCDFRVAAFTNLTQDHLDFHGSMDAYRDSKLRLFRDHLLPSGSAVVNLDDPAACAFTEAARERGVRCIGVSRGESEGALVALEHADVRLDGTTARLRVPGSVLELELPLIGDFNLENLLVACAIATAAEIPAEAIARGVATCPQVPGRIQRVAWDETSAPAVLVDYAHTPDAVDKLLATLRPLAGGRLIAVFGCGGDRDRAKRPMMAEAVARHADRVVATSDNPRTEDPELILDDVEQGLSRLTRVDTAAFDAAEGGYLRQPDRRAAIATAIGIARPEDTVVIAGKGHEDYQIIGRERLPFSDMDEAKRALREAASRGAHASSLPAEPR